MILRQEPCLSCENGIVTFFEVEIDGRKEIGGECDSCGMCCGEKQKLLDI